MNTDFFPPRPPATPTTYAFASTHPDDAGLLKVGYTERAAAGSAGWEVEGVAGMICRTEVLI